MERPPEPNAGSERRAQVKTLSRGLPPTLLVAPNAERVTDEV